MQSQRLSIAESWLEGWSKDWSLLDAIGRARVAFIGWSEYDVRKFQNELSLLLDDYLIKVTGRPRLSITLAQRIDALSAPGRLAKFPGYQEFLGQWIAAIDKGRPYAAHALYRKIASTQMAAFLLFSAATGKPAEARIASHTVDVWDADATGEADGEEKAKASQKTNLDKGREAGVRASKERAAKFKAQILAEARDMRRRKPELSLSAIARSLHSTWLPNKTELPRYSERTIRDLLKRLSSDESAP